MMNNNYVAVLPRTSKSIVCPRCNGVSFSALMLVDSNDEPFSFELTCLTCNKRLGLYTDVSVMRKSKCQELADMPAGTIDSGFTYILPETKITFTSSTISDTSGGSGWIPSIPESAFPCDCHIQTHKLS